MKSMDREDRAIRTAYFLRIPNVGDRINPSIVRALTGRAARHFSGQHQPHLTAAGSVMAGATGLSHIWGTGVMHPDLGVGNAAPANFPGPGHYQSNTYGRYSVDGEVR